MNFERFLSLLLSICLHLCLLAFAIFWPTDAGKPPAMPEGRFISGMISIGKAGKDAEGGRQALPEAARGRPEKTKPIERPTSDAEPVKPSTPVTTPDKPEPKPTPNPVEKPVKKPEPDAVPIPKDPEKKTPPKPEPAPKPPEKPAEQTKPATKKESGEKKKPAPKESLDSALADLSKQVGSPKGKASGKGTASGGKGQDLSSALADLGKQVGSAGGASSGTGPGGSGGDGYGVLGAYQDSIISRVRPNWSWPGRTDRRNYTAVVNIQIDKDGSIRNARIVSSSGNSFFDATVLRAVSATVTLEPPPGPEYADIDISFTPEALGAR